MFNSHKTTNKIDIIGFVLLALALMTPSILVCPLFAQTTVGTGSIVGNVTDPSGRCFRATTECWFRPEVSAR